MLPESLRSTSAAALLCAGALFAGCVTIAWDVPSKHKPFGMKNCRACHDASMRKVPKLEPLPTAPAAPLKDATPEARRQAAQMSSLMRYKADGLCFQCHIKLDPAEMKESPAWLHGPYALGACLVCHSPHESMNPKLLLEYPLAKLCGQCHAGLHKKEKDELYPEENRLGRKSCLDCHNPHYLPEGSPKFPVGRPPL